jgi:S1-C subfamily serine protease
MVRQVVQAAMGGQASVVRPWLGVRGQEVTPELANSLGLDRPAGLLVADVYPGSAAERAGLHPRDVILQAGAQPVNDQSALDYVFATAKPGDEIPLRVRSGKDARTLSVRAEPAPDTPAKDERTVTGRNPLAGATVVNLSPATAQSLGVDPFQASRGVMITRLAEGAIAQSAGVQPGDLIVAVNGRQVRTTADLQGALGVGQGTWRITINRGGQEITGEFSL